MNKRIAKKIVKADAPRERKKPGKYYTMQQLNKAYQIHNKGECAEVCKHG